MNYLEILTSDRTWTCPKDGIYKIIAVGGGSAVSLVTKTSYQSYLFNTAAGGNTSFGDLLTARGGVGKTIVTNYFGTTLLPRSLGGEGGYTLDGYGGAGEIILSNFNSPPSKNGGSAGDPGVGYGASGGFGGSSTIPFSWNIAYHAAATPSTSVGTSQSTGVQKGDAGEVVELITDIGEGTNINCIIGQGGTWTSEALEECANDIGDELVEYFSKKGTAINVEQSSFGETPITEFLYKTTAGKNGCIVIEYIGESL